MIKDKWMTKALLDHSGTIYFENREIFLLNKTLFIFSYLQGLYEMLLKDVIITLV